MKYREGERERERESAYTEIEEISFFFFFLGRNLKLAKFITTHRSKTLWVRWLTMSVGSIHSSSLTEYLLVG